MAGARPDQEQHSAGVVRHLLARVVQDAVAGDRTGVRGEPPGVELERRRYGDQISGRDATAATSRALHRSIVLTYRFGVGCLHGSTPLSSSVPTA